MQNRYSGDVGDFSKFSLLKFLFPDDQYRLGLIWYKYPDENHNTDGRHVQYLNEPKFKDCDPVLVNKLSVVTKGERSVAHLERLKILPANTVYYSELLDFHLKFNQQTKADRLARRESRLNWLGNACLAVKDCNVLCLDPDNGMEIKSVPSLSHMKSGKYAYYSEVVKLYSGKKACVIYQHLNRTSSHSDQIKQRGNALKELISKEGSVFVLRFSPYSPRAYFILARADVAGTIKQKLDEYMGSPCGDFWVPYLNLET